MTASRPNARRRARCAELLVALIATVIACAKTPAPTARASAAGQSPSATLAIVGVDVIPMEGPERLAAHTVLVDGDRVTWIGPSAEARVPSRARVIDGSGRYLVPGLIDMHVHLRDDDELLMYLANGVTTVANLSGSPRHLEWRAAISEGSVLGPTVFTAGPTIDGDPPRNPIFLGAGDAARAAELVDQQRAAGYDFVKVYDLIDKPAYDGVTAAARRHGVPVVGHIPKKFGLEGIVGGHSLVAHAEEYFYTFFEFHPDRSRLAEAARVTREARIALCPNTGFIEAIIAQAEDIDAVLAWPEVKYVPPASLASWLPENNRYTKRDAAWLARNKIMYPFLLELTRAMHEAGVLLVVGTDASIAGGAPGFAIHRELDNLVRSGLTPFEALSAATRNPGLWLAEHLETPGRRGVIAVDAVADMVLLAGDPRADLGVLRQPVGVMTRGRWLAGAELRETLEKRSIAYREIMAVYQRFRGHIAADRFADAEAILTTAAADAPIHKLLSENALNAMGYGFLFEKTAGGRKRAIAVFEINVRAHPESSNVYDSLGEAHMLDGNSALAIENYRKSLDRNAGNENARRMLKKLGAEGAD